MSARAFTCCCCRARKSPHASSCVTALVRAQGMEAGLFGLPARGADIRLDGRGGLAAGSCDAAEPAARGHVERQPPARPRDSAAGEFEACHHGLCLMTVCSQACRDMPASPVLEFVCLQTLSNGSAYTGNEPTAQGSDQDAGRRSVIV